MKTQSEIQRAHDLLVGIILKEIVPTIDEEDREKLAEVACVLCWVLEHQHNTKFGELLECLEQIAQSAGYRLTEHGN